MEEIKMAHPVTAKAQEVCAKLVALFAQHEVAKMYITDIFLFENMSGADVYARAIYGAGAFSEYAHALLNPNLGLYKITGFVDTISCVESPILFPAVKKLFKEWMDKQSRTDN